MALPRGVRLTTHLHLVERFLWVELYLHSNIRLHGAVLKYRDNFTFTISLQMIGTNECITERGHFNKKATANFYELNIHLTPSTLNLENVALNT
jgi:hypothetical protein